MKISIDNLKTLENKLAKSGILNFAKNLPAKAEVYLVGGAVRDALLGAPDSGDYDFVVRNVNAKKLEQTLSKFGQVDFVGKRFGVFKFMPKRLAPEFIRERIEPVDIALPRTEHSLGTGAYRDFKIKSNPKFKIEEDLSRRDFSINAIAHQLLIINYLSRGNSRDQLSSKLIDPYNGIPDLQNKTIRTVGSPADRFQEDYSRLLRAIRLACQLNFTIEKNTWTAIKKLMSHLNDKKDEERVIPYEVIASELLKALTNRPARALDLLDESGAIIALMPELLKMKGCPQPENWHSEGDVWEHTKLALSLLQSKGFKREFKQKQLDTDSYGFTTDSHESRIDSELVLAVLFHDIGKPYVVETPEKDGTDRIRFYGHEKEGEHLTRKICRRLRLQAPPEFDVDCDRIAKMVGKHLLCVNSKIEAMKNLTIVKYFIRDPCLGKNFMKLFWLDAMSSIPEKGRPDLSQYKKLKKRIEQVKKTIFKSTPKIHQSKIKLDSRGRFKALINGDDIMKEFKLKPGKKIGELLDLVREEQLAGRVGTKKEALAFLKHEVK